MVKFSKSKLSGKLSALSKLNMYKSLKSSYSKSGLSFWSSKQKMVSLVVDEHSLMMSSASSGKFMTLKMVKSSLLVSWGKTASGALKSLYLEDLFSGSGVINGLSVLSGRAHTSFPAVFSFISLSYNFLFNSTVGSVGTMNNVLVLKNKSTQFYLTLLSNQFWGWKTDVSIYPGVVASLFGANQKSQSVMYKKKDKSMMKVMQKSVSVMFPKVLEPSTKVLLIMSKKPKSSEVYKHFIQLLVNLYKLKLDFVLFSPEISHCFVKLSKYASIKSSLSKSMSKSVEGMTNTNLSKESSYNKIMESYVSKSKA